MKAARVTYYAGGRSTAQVSGQSLNLKAQNPQTNSQKLRLVVREAFSLSLSFSLPLHQEASVVQSI